MPRMKTSEKSQKARGNEVGMKQKGKYDNPRRKPRKCCFAIYSEDGSVFIAEYHASKRRKQICKEKMDSKLWKRNFEKSTGDIGKDSFSESTQTRNIRWEDSTSGFEPSDIKEFERFCERVHKFYDDVKIPEKEFIPAKFSWPGSTKNLPFRAVNFHCETGKIEDAFFF